MRPAPPRRPPEGRHRPDGSGRRHRGRPRRRRPPPLPPDARGRGLRGDRRVRIREGRPGPAGRAGRVRRLRPGRPGRPGRGRLPVPIALSERRRPMTVRERLASLDAFRGFDILTMVFVNYIAGMKAIPFFLRHAAADQDVFTLTADVPAGHPGAGRRGDAQRGRDDGGRPVLTAVLTWAGLVLKPDR
ncbi:MAG: hypothetical protein M0C28_07255 [Candidatus Moduliflexus flocculans]|nr:hypothetical protein [Candidatus Moduliflexus flocculans]